MGAEAALAVLDAKADTAPCVICLDGNKIAKRPLMECVEKVSFFFCLSGRALLIKVLMSLGMILSGTNAIYAMALELEILQNSDHSCSKCGQHCPFQTT